MAQRPQNPESVPKSMQAVYDGVRTADLGGHSSTSHFTDEIIRQYNNQHQGKKKKEK